MPKRNTAKSQTISNKPSIKTVPFVTIDLKSTCAQFCKGIEANIAYCYKALEESKIKNEKRNLAHSQNIAYCTKALEESKIKNEKRNLAGSQRVESNQPSILPTNNPKRYIYNSAKQLTEKNLFACDESYLRNNELVASPKELSDRSTPSQYGILSSLLEKQVQSCQSSMSSNIEENDTDGGPQKPYSFFQNAMLSKNDTDGGAQKPCVSEQKKAIFVDNKKDKDVKESTTSFFTYFTSLLPSCSMFSYCTQQEVDKKRNEFDFHSFEERTTTTLTASVSLH